MFESEEQRKRAELIITLLAKLYVVLELSVDKLSRLPQVAHARRRMSNISRLVPSY